jgi:general secretion pathway protein J
VRSRRDVGFTLVELIIGLLLLGFLSVLMLSGFEVTVSAWHRVDSHGAAGRARQAAEAQLRRVLAQAAPLPVVDAFGGQSVDFAGREQMLSFLAPLPERFGARVIVRYRLDRDGKELRLAWSLPDGEAVESADDRPPTVLLDDLSSLAISYFGLDDPAEPPHWQQHWENRTVLPALIKIELAETNVETAGWPDLVVAPLITNDPIAGDRHCGPGDGAGSCSGK